uniref:Uncharacterized protein n=1 Tax=Arundo donax TaxID=35708 RepID=A0A0A8Y817_ARUDO
MLISHQNGRNTDTKFASYTFLLSSIGTKKIINTCHWSCTHFFWMKTKQC